MEPRRRAERSADRPSGGARRRAQSGRRSRRWISAAIAGGLVAVLGAGLGITYVATADDQVAPTRLTFEPVSPTSTTLTWRGTEDADKYVVTVGADRALSNATKTTVAATKSSVTLDDLAAASPGIDQFFRVDAVYGEKVVSSRTSSFQLPPAPMGKIEVPKVASNGVELEWPKVVNARNYDIAWAPDKNFAGATAVRSVDAVNKFTIGGLQAATAYFVKVRPVNGEQVGAWSEPVAFESKVSSTKFRVATWNVCSEKCSGYSGRARIMASFLNENEVDIFALQESGGVRVGRTTNAIFSGGERGFQRATGGAKARYIFFRPALFEQLGGGYFGVGHDRHATWAQFKVKETGRTFFVVDVHLENGHGNDGKRRSEMSTLLGRMRSINAKGDPIIYAGDFNSGRHRSSDSPGAMLRGAGIVDTVDTAKEVENRQINTGHTFSTSVLRSGAHVDHVFASEQFQVLRWKQLVRISGSSYTKPVVSDHNAVSADLALANEKSDIGKSSAFTPLTKNDLASLQ